MPVRVPRRFSRTWWATVLLALLVLAFVDAGCRAALGYRDLDAAAEHLRAVAPVLDPVVRFDAEAWPDREQLAEARARIAEARRLVERGNGRLAYLPAAGNALGWLPYWGESAANGDDALDALVALAPVLDRLVQRLDLLIAGEGRIADRAYATFVENGDALVADLETLVAEQQEVARLAAVDWKWPLSGAADALDLAGERLDRAGEALALATDLRDGLPVLLGYEGAHTVLLLGQNDHEVRPTGGFIGTAGLLTFEDGQVTERRFGASYDLDRPDDQPWRDPPADLSRSLGIGEWHLRDVNWSPDFRESGATALRFLQEDRGLVADSAVIVDSHLVALLLRALGPVEVEGYPEPLTAENWFVQVENTIYAAEFGSSAAPGDVGREGANLVSNADFEQSAAGWNAVGAASVGAVEVEGAAFGTRVLRVEAASLGDGATYAGAANAGAGATYTASLSIRAASGDAGHLVQLLVAAPGGVYEQFAAAVTLTEEWQRVALTYTYAEAAHSGWRLTVRDVLGTPVTFEIDGVQVEQGDAATAYEPAPDLTPEQAASREQARQQYLAPILDLLIADIESASGETVAQVIRSLQDAAAQRHLQLYSPDARVQALSERFNVSGALDVPPDGDLLAVVDANVSYNKIQPAISRSVTYLSGEAGFVDMVVRWRNDLPTFDGDRYARLGQGGGLWDPNRFAFEAAPGVFATYTRFYLPADATAITAQGFELGPALELTDGHFVLGGRVVVPPGEEATVVVRYQLPERPAFVRLWRQGGFQSTTVRVLMNQAGTQATLFEGVLASDMDVPLVLPESSPMGLGGDR